MDVKIDAAGTVVHVDINDFTIAECNCEFIIIKRYREFHENMPSVVLLIFYPFCECFSLCRVYFRIRARLSAFFEFDEDGVFFEGLYCLHCGNSIILHVIINRYALGFVLEVNYTI